MTALIAMLLTACTGTTEPAPACADPLQYWPDDDGDGLGEPGQRTYVGCTPPEGWVAQVADEDVSDTYVWDTGPFIIDDSGDSGGGSGFSGLTGGTGLFFSGLTGLTGDTGLYPSGLTGLTGETGTTGDTGP